MVANAILKNTDVKPYGKIGDLPDEDIDKLNEVITTINDWLPTWMRNRSKDMFTGKDLHLIGTEIETTLREDVNVMKKIRCYRGIRHERGLAARGQRTRSNKRRGLSVGVMRRRVQQRGGK